MSAAERGVCDVLSASGLPFFAAGQWPPLASSHPRFSLSGRRDCCPRRHGHRRSSRRECRGLPERRVTRTRPPPQTSRLSLRQRECELVPAGGGERGRTEPEEGRRHLAGWQIDGRGVQATPLRWRRRRWLRGYGSTSAVAEVAGPRASSCKKPVCGWIFRVTARTRASLVRLRLLGF